MKWQCALLQRWLPEYPDGDLSAFWRGRLEAHLAHCPACRAEQQSLKEVVDAIQAAPAADPGPEFWAEFSREMHLKLVQAGQEGQLAPARSVWWGRLPYLVGAPALAALILWVAVGYLSPERPGMVPAPAPLAKGKVSPQAQPPAMAKKKSPGPAENMAAAPPAVPRADEPPSLRYVSKGSGNHHGDEMSQDDELDDLDATLAGMTPQEKEAFLKKLSQHQKDGSCLTSFSTVFWA